MIAYHAYLVGKTNINACVVQSPYLGSCSWFVYHLFTTRDAHIAGRARATSTRGYSCAD